MNAHEPSLPSAQQPTDTVCLLPHGADVGPLLEVQPIQQYNSKAANHTPAPESCPESYPRIIPPYSNFPARLR